MESESAPLPLTVRLWTWFETHKKPTGYAVIALVAAGVIGGFVYWRSSEKEIAANEALSAVSAPNTPNPGARPGAAEAFLKVAADFPGSSAALRAVLFAATSYFMEGRYTEAKSQFDRFARENRESAFLGQALLGSAACLDAEGKTDEAITGYKNLIERHSNDSNVQQARLALARLYEGKNQIAEARALYEEIGRNDPFRSSIGDQAAMRLEDLRRKYPAPALTPQPMPKQTITLPPSPAVPKPSVSTTTNAKPAAAATSSAPIVLPGSNAPFKLQTH
jgi:tetratricopeptide (TPR) repeat protein